nr:immunoglobulin light chain junction region [Macaca mulatta]MOW40546.1 immunoglobulin light chain junction region [Macaca mulatta]
CQQYNSLSLTF